MDKNVIGTNAGIVWRTMTGHYCWTYEDLKEQTELSDKELWAAIGWLAREDKIDFEKDCDEDCLFLSVNIYIG